MAKISTTKKIVIEEFPKEVRSWVGKLIDPINRFFEQTYFALSKGITTADNLKAQRFDLIIEVNQTFPMKVTWNLNERPTMLLIGQINEFNGVSSVGTHSMEWTIDSGNILITFSGLSSSKRYRATIIGIV
jgi:hypothetical protein